MEIDIILNEFASPSEAAELGLMAERYGMRGVWASNYGWSRDPFFTLSLLAHQSSRIRLGPMAISPAELHPLKMANLLFSLNELSRGRAMIMVGGGGAVLQSIGKKRERMIRGARECLQILKGASPDKLMNYNGEIYKVWGYQPKWYTDRPPLIYFGSNHPQSRKLSAELADGLITSDFVPSLMKEFVDSTHADLRAAGRSPRDFRISNFWAWHIKKDAAASMAEARRELMLRGWLVDQYFAPFLDPDELRVMRAHEKDFLNAFLRGQPRDRERAGRPRQQDDQQHLLRRRARPDRAGHRDAEGLRGGGSHGDRAPGPRPAGRRYQADRRAGAAGAPLRPSR